MNKMHGASGVSLVDPGTAAHCGDTGEEHLIPTKEGLQGRGPVLPPPREAFQCHSLVLYTPARKKAELED